MQLNKQILDEISRQIQSKSFHKTELYQILKTGLSNIGNWKAKQRGNPKAGYQAMIDLQNGNRNFQDVTKQGIILNG